MCRTARSALVILLLSLCLTRTLAQSPSQSQSQGGTAAVTGRVTVNGKPVAGIVLMAMPAKGSAELVRMLSGSQFERAATDEDGRFRITGLDAGYYEIVPHAPSLFVSSQPGQEGFGRAVTVGEGETVAGVNFAMIRGGVITGRVTHSDGRPAINEPLRASIAGERQAGWQTNPLTQTEFFTDDRGVYRIFGLPAGRYVVSVGGVSRSGEIGIGIRLPSRPPTFHPGATDEARATVVEVTAGGEKVNVDIRLGLSTRTFKASGRVVDAETGNPIPNVITAHNSVMGEAPAPPGRGYGSVTKASGEFRLEGLEPGRHSAFAVFGNGESDFYSESVQFEVKNEDVAGLEIKVHRGGTISGVVAVDGASDPAVLARLSQLELIAEVVGDASITSKFSTSQVAANGSFILRGVPPGQVRIRLFDFLSQQPFSLVRVEHNGAEMRGGVPMAPAEHLTGVRVVVAYASGVIRGLVKVEGEIPKGARIVVSVEKGETSTGDDDDDDQFDFFMDGQSTVADSSGRFSFDRLLPGDYRVVAKAVLQSPAGRALAEAMEPVAVSASGESFVTILLDLRGKSKVQQ